MRLLLFTKNHDEYSPFINACIGKFDSFFKLGRILVGFREE